MKQKNKEIIQRALGIVEGVWFLVHQDAKDALSLAVEMIDDALKDEEDGKDGK